jgi:hypothetical protein
MRWEDVRRSGATNLFSNDNEQLEGITNASSSQQAVRRVCSVRIFARSTGIRDDGLAEQASLLSTSYCS